MDVGELWHDLQRAGQKLHFSYLLHWFCLGGQNGKWMFWISKGFGKEFLKKEALKWFFVSAPIHFLKTLPKASLSVCSSWLPWLLVQDWQPLFELAQPLVLFAMPTIAVPLGSFWPSATFSRVCKKRDDLNCSFLSALKKRISKLRVRSHGEGSYWGMKWRVVFSGCESFDLLSEEWHHSHLRHCVRCAKEINAKSYINHTHICKVVVMISSSLKTLTSYIMPYLPRTDCYGYYSLTSEKTDNSEKTIFNWT